MSEYLPIHTPGRAVTMTAAATITAGQLVDLDDGHVKPTSGPSAAVVGHAATDAQAGEHVAIHSRHSHTHRADTLTAITAGQLVAAGPGGTVQAWDSGDMTDTDVLGVALDDSAGGVITWRG